MVLTARTELAVKLHCVNHELGFPEHCYCAMQYKTSLEYFSLVHCIAMIEYLYMDLKLSVAFCHFFDHHIALHNILFYHGLKLGENLLSQMHDLR